MAIVKAMSTRQPCVLLNFRNDGQSNVLEITVSNRIETYLGIQSIADYWHSAQNVCNNRNCVGRNLSNSVAKSTDFACSQPGCTYHHKLESKYILHARSHLTFEVSPDAKNGTVMRFDRDCLKYVCSTCPRMTTDITCFREHLRHHLFQRPYVCSVCKLPLSSIAEVRLHFRKKHPNQILDLTFSEADCPGVLDNLLNLLHSSAKPFDKPFKLFIVDRSCFDESGPAITNTADNKTNSVINATPVTLKLLGNGSAFVPSVTNSLKTVWFGGSYQELLQSKTAPYHRLPAATATCSFVDGTYSCHNCSYKTGTMENFSTHVWKHIHNAWGSECKHGSKTNGVGCLVLRGLNEILSCNASKRIGGKTLPLSMIPKVGYDSFVGVEGKASCTSGDRSNQLQSSLKVIGTILPMEQKSNPRAIDEPGNEMNVIDNGEKLRFRNLNPDDLNASSSSECKKDMFILRQETTPMTQKCVECSFTCDTIEQMSSHSAECHIADQKRQRFNCLICSMGTLELQTLMLHVAHHVGEHTVSYSKCVSCNFSTMLNYEMTSHERSCHAGNKESSVSVSETVKYLQNVLKCPYCSMALLWGDVFHNHIRKRHKLYALSEYLKEKYHEDIYPYHSCPAVLTFPKRLLNAASRLSMAKTKPAVLAHNCRSSEIYKFHCDSCQFSTNNNSKFADHRLSHSSDSNNTASRGCPSCSFVARTDTEFHRHIRDHEKYDDITNGYSCGECFFKHPHQSVVEDHVSNFHYGKSELVVKIVSHEKVFSKCKNRKQCKQKEKSTKKDKSVKKKVSYNPSVSHESTFSLLPYSGSTKSRNSVSTLNSADNPVELHSFSTLDDFEKKLPNTPVFRQDIQCPECSFSNRFRVNLIRHVRMHIQKAKGVVTTDKTSNSSLSYSLWRHPVAEKNGDKSCGRLANQLLGTEDAAEVELDNIALESLTDDDTRDTQISSLRIDVPNGIPRGVSAAIAVADVQSHVTSEVSGGCFICDQCDNRYISKADLERHIQYHNKPHVCHICGMMCYSESNIKKHYATEHCGEALEDITLTHAGLNGSHVENASSADSCVTNHVARLSLDVNLEASRYFVCGKCENRYICAADLEHHICQCHKGPYVCHICGVLMNMESSMSKHYERDHCGVPVRFEVPHKQSRDTSGVANCRKKVARIQGVLRAEELLEEKSLEEHRHCQPGQLLQPNLQSQLDDIHSVSAIGDVSHIIEAPKIVTSKPAAPDNHSTEDHFKSSACASNPTQASLSSHESRNASSHTSIIDSLEPCDLGQTALSEVLPVNADSNALCNVQKGQPGAPIFTPASISAPFASVGTSVDGQTVTGIHAHAQNVCPPIPQTVWSSNYASNILSAFGNVTFDALQSMLAANLVPLLANMLNNPAMLPELLRLLGNSLTGNGFTPQHAAMLSSYLSAVKQPSFLAEPCNSDTSSRQLNAQVDPPTHHSMLTDFKADDDSSSVVLTDSPPSRVGGSSASANSQPACVGAENFMAPTKFVTKSGVTCSLIPLSSHVDLTSSKSRRYTSPVPSPVSIASDTNSDSGIDKAPYLVCDPEEGRKRTRSRTTSPVGSSSHTSKCVSSKQSSCESSRRKKRRKTTIDDDEEQKSILFTCNMCTYSTRSRSNFSKHVRLELSAREALGDSMNNPPHQALLTSSQNQKRLGCCYCSFSTSLHDEFNQHMRTHSVVKRYRCVYCSFAGYSSNEVKRHVARDHPKRPFAIYREWRPTYVRGVRTVDFDPTICAVDVLKMSHRRVRRLMSQNNVNSIDFCH